MKTQKIDFKEITAQDLDGGKVILPPTFAKDLGNKLYVSAPDIEVADLGRKLHASQATGDLQLNKADLTLLLTVFDSARLLGQPAHLATKEYLSKKLSEANE